jgi:hypothetical protein
VKNIGDEMLNEIIREDLVWAETEGVCVWKANAAEILEAIATKHCHELFRRMTGAHDYEGGNEGSNSQNP